jgi:hypothetical protein
MNFFLTIVNQLGLDANNFVSIVAEIMKIFGDLLWFKRIF